MRALPSIILLLLLAGCGALQTQSTTDSIAIGYVTVETLAETALVAYQEGKIDDATRHVIIKNLQLAKDTLDVATEYATSENEDAAIDSLNAAYALLDIVRGFIQ